MPEQSSAPPRRIPADAWLAVALLLMFGMMHNRFWSRGGDSDVYLAMARNLALHRGYTFNQEPVAVVSPLWPLLLAGFMKISASFSFLKLLTMLFMTAGLLLWYRVLLRITTPAIAFWAVLIAGMLQPLATLTFQFHTENLFMPIAAGVLLVALQINRDAATPGRIVLLLLLCVASIATRWAGLLWWALIAGALLDGRAIFSRGALRRHARMWGVIAATLAVTLITFVILRHVLRVSPQRVDPRYDSTLAVHYELINDDPDPQAYVGRFTAAGRWIGGLLWEPLTLYGKHLRKIIGGFGFIPLVVVLLRLPTIFQRRRWLIIAMIGYFAVLCMDWPSPVPRYLVPLTPLLLAVMGMASADWIQAAGSIGRWVIKPLVVLFIVSILLCNSISILIEASVAHSSDFYGTYEAGLDQSLINCAAWLRDHHAGNADIAMSRVDENLGKGRFSNGWMRALVVLADRGVRTVPDELTGTMKPDRSLAKPLDPMNASIQQWLIQQNIKYYLYRPESSVFWHFDLAAKSRAQAVDAMDWRLYAVHPTGLERIIPERTYDWPKQMPGMTDR